MLHIRDATAADAALLFAWANDPATRQAMRNTDPIDWDEHVAWLQARLAEPAVVIHIVETDGDPAAVVRYEPRAEGHEVSVTLAPERRGQALGAEVLAVSAAAFPHRPVVANTRPGNVPFMRAAVAAGYRPDGRAPDGLIRFRLD